MKTPNRSITFTAANEVALTETGTTPDPAADGILIETECSILSTGTELACLSGSEAWAPFPFTPGYGSVGTIVAVGPQVSGFQPGDRVFTYGRHEAFSLANTVTEKLPTAIPGEKAVFARMAAVAITALRVADAELGDPVAVVGLGLVGNLAAQLFQLAGCDVIGVDPSPSRRHYATAVGIPQVLEPGPDLEAQIIDLTQGAKCRSVVDATGVPAVVNTLPTLAGKLGELILLGSPRGVYQTDLTAFLNFSHLAGHGNVTIKGAHEYRFPLSEDPEKRYRHSFQSNVKTLLNRIQDDRLNTEALISHRAKPEDAPDVYRALQAAPGDYLGVIFDWTNRT